METIQIKISQKISSET